MLRPAFALTTLAAGIFFIALTLGHHWIIAGQASGAVSLTLLGLALVFRCLPGD